MDQSYGFERFGTLTRESMLAAMIALQDEAPEPLRADYLVINPSMKEVAKSLLENSLTKGKWDENVVLNEELPCHAWFLTSAPHVKQG